VPLFGAPGTAADSERPQAPTWVGHGPAAWDTARRVAETSAQPAPGGGVTAVAGCLPHHNPVPSAAAGSPGAHPTTGGPSRPQPQVAVAASAGRPPSFGPPRSGPGPNTGQPQREGVVSTAGQLLGAVAQVVAAAALGGGGSEAVQQPVATYEPARRHAAAEPLLAATLQQLLQSLGASLGATEAAALACLLQAAQQLPGGVASGAASQGAAAGINLPPVRVPQPQPSEAGSGTAMRQTVSPPCAAAPAVGAATPPSARKRVADEGGDDATAAGEDRAPGTPDKRRC
jgi:hypothetical protein